MSFDVIIQNGTVFDGSGADGKRQHVGIQGGKVTALSDTPLRPGPHTEVIDARDQWVIPGFIDIHTHYDAEVEIDPSLFESVRHGVTTMIMGSCSLSMAVGEPKDLADMFCRVEGIPRATVLPLLEKLKDWDSPAGYARHLQGLNLGPNIACLLGHSTIRSAAMGMEKALTAGARPTAAELATMDGWLQEALDEGYLGLSISTLPWDKMDGEDFRSRPMPSVFARYSEYRHFNRTLRERDRVLQVIPNISSKVNIPLFFLMSAGLFRKPLRTSVVAMIDARADRIAFRIAGWLARLTNRWLGGNFRMQALPELFDLWADGIDLVVFEEFEAGTAALHLQDLAERKELLANPAYRKRFKKQWNSKLLPRAYHRNFALSEILACPDTSVVGKSFADVAREQSKDVVDVFLDLVMEHGPALRWYSVLGNDRPRQLQSIVSHPDILIGFSDAGAHLRNMAHYNFPLRLLEMVQASHQAGKPIMSLGRAVHRLTGEIADWLQIDAGHLEVGRRADVVVVDPSALDERLAQIHEAPMPGFDGLQRLVRRNDAAVPAVLVNGRIAARAGERAPNFGTSGGYGRFLRAGECPAPAASEGAGAQAA